MAKGDFGRRMNEGMRGAERRIVEWSRGRNGADELSSAMTNLAVVLVVVAVITRVTALSLLALVLLGYSWFRIASKNVTGRARENSAALKAAGPVIRWLVNPVAAYRETRAYKHLACPSCGQRVRIPRGKGKVRVTCPKCHARFEGKA